MQELVQLVSAQIVPEALQPVHELLIALHRLISHRGETAHQLLTGQRNNHSEKQQQTQLGDSSRAAGPHALLPQEHDGRAQQSRQEHGHHHRDDQQGDVPQALPHDPARAGNHDEAPGPRAGHVHGEGNPVALPRPTFFGTRYMLHAVSLSQARQVAGRAGIRGALNPAKAAKAAAPLRYRRFVRIFSRC